MPEEPFTNREIKEMFKDLQLSNGRIEGKVDHTNGRVKELELNRARQDGFNRATAIFGSGAWVLCLGLFGWLSLQVIDGSAKIDRLNAKLSAYQINVEQ